MDRPPAVRFAHVARCLGAATRAAGLVVPAFRTPPRRAGAPRTIRRLPGGPVVAVAVRDRSYAAVVGDMVEGVVVANNLEGESRGAGARRIAARRADRDDAGGGGVAFIRSARVAERQTQAA